MYINKDQTEILIKKESYIFKDSDKENLEAKNLISCNLCEATKDNTKLNCCDIPCSPSGRKDGKNGYFIKRPTTL